MFGSGKKQKQEKRLADRQFGLQERALDIGEQERIGVGEISQMILDMISGSSALDPGKVRAQGMLETESQTKREQDFLSGQQGLPGQGDVRDTVSSEQRAMLVAAQEDMRIRRNRFLDLTLLQSKMQALMQTAQLGGIRPGARTERQRERYGENRGFA